MSEARDLVGPLLFAAFRKFNRDFGRPITRVWREEARHELLYVSQSATSARTALERDSYTDVQLAVELEELIGKMTALRDAILPASRETS